MNPEALVAAILEYLGETAGETAVWPTLGPLLAQIGKEAGLSIDIQDALTESATFTEFVGRLATSIAGGDIGAAVAVVIGGTLLGVEVEGAGFLAAGGALYFAAVAAGLPEAVALGGVAVLLGGLSVVGSVLANKLFNVAYGDLVQAFNNLNAPAPATWKLIGADSSGNSILLEAVNSNAIGLALGLGNGSALIVDIAASAEGSSSPLANGDIAGSSLLTDANLLGAAVGAGEIGGSGGSPLAGSAVTGALAEILVQYAGDQAAAANANGRAPTAHTRRAAQAFESASEIGAAENADQNRAVGLRRTA